MKLIQALATPSPRGGPPPAWGRAQTAMLGLAASLAACKPAGGIEPSSPSHPPAVELTGEAASDRAHALAVRPHAVAVLPTGLTTAAGTELGGFLYLLGGYFGKPHQYSREYQNSDFLRLELASGRWDTLESVGGIQSARLVNDGRYVYRIGGMRARNAAGDPEDMQSVSEVARFDPATQSWQDLTPLPQGRSSHQAVLVGQRLYVVGGWTLSGGPGDQDWRPDVLWADLGGESLDWKALPMPALARAGGAAAVDGKLYVVGGLGPAGAIRSVHVLDLETETWSAGPEVPAGNITPMAVAHAGQLYCNGADGHVYRLVGDEWLAVTSLAFPRMFHEWVPSAGGPIAVGGVPGQARGKRLRVVERLSPGVSQAGFVARLKSKSSAKNRQGALLAGHQLRLFGGNNSLGQHDFAPDNFVQTAVRLDLGSLELFDEPELPAARQSMQVLADEEGRAWAFGGFGFKGESLATQPDIWGFDPEARAWVKRAELPAARSQFGVAAVAGEMWVLGGLNYEQAREPAFQHPKEVLRMGPATPGSEPTVAFRLKEPRRAFAGAQFGNEYFLVGGLKQDFQSVTTCEAWNLATAAHRSIACPSAHRLGGALIPLGETLYLVGGSVKDLDGKRQPTGRLEAYDVALDRWTTLVEQLPLSTPRQLQAFPFGDQLLLYSAQLPTQHVEIALLSPEALAAGHTGFARLEID